MKWEYEKIWLDVVDDDIEGFLNHRGKQGFELVSTIAIEDRGSMVLFVFKRPAVAEECK